MRYFALLMLTMLMIGACDLFRLREPQTPTKPPLWNNYATECSLSVQNLRYCYEDARNVVKYSQLFTDDYRFHFSAQDINDYGINMIWNRANEQDMLLTLHNQCDSLTLNLETVNGQNDDIGATEAKLYRRYDLYAYKTGVSAPEVYSGNLEIHMRNLFGYWYISRWYDYRSLAAPTWGKLKYDHAQ